VAGGAAAAGAAAAAPALASAKASLSSGVTSDLVRLMVDWISSAFLNCLMPRSRCLNPTMMTIPMWMWVRAVIGC
jgi:hypothetical protein